MNNQTLPVPNPNDWSTYSGAAALLGVSTRTVKRMVADGRLRAYAPIGAHNGGHLLWVPEVVELAYAIARARGAGRLAVR